MRTTPIGAESYQVLNRYLKKSAHTDKAVFVNKNGQRLSTRWVQDMGFSYIPLTCRPLHNRMTDRHKTFFMHITIYYVYLFLL
jgi:hypothetical protein